MKEPATPADPIGGTWRYAAAAFALAALIVSCSKGGPASPGEKEADDAAGPGRTAKPEETPGEKPGGGPAAARNAALSPRPLGQAGPSKEPDLRLDTKEKKISYCIGLTMMGSLKSQGVAVDAEALLQGVKDSFPGEEPLLTKEQIGEIMRTFQQDLRAKQQAKMAERMAETQRQRGLAAKKAPENKKRGETFLAGNAKRPGVVKRPSGLQYEVIKEGTGRKPTTADRVICHYRGTFIDGREFDSSYKRGRPAEFPVTGVIRGWTEALQLMKTGAKWKLYIPSDLAYGRSGRGGIGPNETLVFDIELVRIK